MTKRDVIWLAVNPKNERYEFYYTVDDMRLRCEECSEIVETVKQFDKEYFYRNDLPLGYIVIFECNKVVDVYAIALHAGDFGPEVYFVNVKEWMENRKITNP